MEESPEVGVEVREEIMVPATGDGIPTKKLAHFLKPTINSSDGSVFELPSHCLAGLPTTFEPKKWPLKVAFHGWRFPQRDWKTWVVKMASLHESTWEKAGIREAILNSIYKINRNDDLVLGLAEKWCRETKSFIFSWGEATITLEDVMIAGYSVLGSPVFSPLGTGELKETEKKLNQVRLELCRSTARKAEHSLWMKKFMDNGSEIEHEAFIALWLSRFVFPGSYSLMVKSVFPVAVHLARGTRIALAPAILASLYKDLSSLKEKIVALTILDNWGDKDGKLAITIRAPFQIVQIWAWERFLLLRPEPNLIKTGEPRFARWHEKMIGVENARTVLDSAREDFDWRPYVKPVKNWDFPKFYGEKEMWVSVDPNLSEELQSFAQCLRMSGLVGLDCTELYFPQRVAMQFGMDQDLPACDAGANETPYTSWNYYSKPINYALYIPSRLNEGDVTARYSEWWKQSISNLQDATELVLPQKRIFKNSEITAKKLKRVTESSVFGITNVQIKAKRMKEGNTFSSFKAEPKRFDRLKKGEAVSSHPSFHLKSSEELPGTSKLKKRDINAFVADEGPSKEGKEPVETSKEKKVVSNVSASAGTILEKLPLNLSVKMEVNDSPFPPGFAPKSNMVKASDSTEEDDMTIAEFSQSETKHDVVNKQVTYSENSPPSQPQILSSSIADNEVVNIIEPQIGLAEKIMQNEAVKCGSEATGEHATETETKAGSPDNDVDRIQRCEEDGTKNAIETPNMQLEDRVRKLEKIIAGLKAARFGHK